MNFFKKLQEKENQNLWGSSIPPLHVKMLDMQEKYRQTGEYPVGDLREILGDPNYSIKIGPNINIFQSFGQYDSESETEES